MKVNQQLDKLVKQVEKRNFTNNKDQDKQSENKSLHSDSGTKVRE